MARIRSIRILAPLCGVLVLFATALPASAASTDVAPNSPSGNSAVSTNAPISAMPATCGWEVAESAYNTVSGTNYAVTDLNYSTCTRNVYASIGSYVSACASSPTGVGCGAAEVERSDTTSAVCEIPTGQTGCNTSQLSDAGYTSKAFGIIQYSSGNYAQVYTGSF